MSNIILQLKERLPIDIFTDSEMANLITGSPDRRYGLIKRAIAQGDLIQIRRGVYSLGKRFQRAPLNPFELAQKIYAPSYVSLESALSYHGWIPEGVYTVTSVNLKRSAVFETPVGTFSYTRIPEFNFIGVERVTEGLSIYLLATPTKALADYIATHKVDLAPKELMHFLRIENDMLRQLSFEILDEVVEIYGNLRLRKFVKALRKGGRL